MNLLNWINNGMKLKAHIINTINYMNIFVQKFIQLNWMEMTTMVTNHQWKWQYFHGFQHLSKQNAQQYVHVWIAWINKFSYSIVIEHIETIVPLKKTVFIWDMIEFWAFYARNFHYSTQQHHYSSSLFAHQLICLSNLS